MDKLCGFNNIGNTCYLNSALQLLINCTVLTKFILSFNFKSDKLNEIKNFLQKYKSSNVISPIDIKNIVAQKDEKFASFNQNDSHEFLILLLEIIENELKKEDEANIGEVNIKNLVSTLFSTTVSSIIYCEELDKKSKNKIEENILSLPIPNKDHVTLNDCIEKYTEIEHLSGDSKWYDDSSKKYYNAYKRLYLKSLPKYLIINLKRFSFFSRSNKNNSPVYVDNTLNIRDHQYKLTGIIIQDGNANFGHYYAIINNNNKWYMCNDSSISELSDIEQYKNRGYVYLFNKQK